MPGEIEESRVRRDAEYTYILDCAVELGEITPLEAEVFLVDTPAGRALTMAMDRQERWTKHFLRNTARGYLNQLSRKERWVWAIRGLKGSEFGLVSLQERMSFVLQTKVQSDLGLQERHAISWLDELKDEGALDGKVFETVHCVTPDKVRQYLEPLYGSSIQMLEEDVELAYEALDWLSKPGAREEAKAIAARLFAIPDTSDCGPLAPQAQTAQNVAPGAVPLRKLLKKKDEQRQARGAIKKALSLLTSFGMKKDVDMLISGYAVSLSHPDSPFKLDVQPLHSGWLEARTLRPGRHTPFQLSLLTKDDVFISRLCVLFDNTPVLDQLLALSMYVKTGNEMELLEKANWFGYESSEKVRGILQETAPSLVKKLPQPRTSGEDGRRTTFIRDPFLEEMQRLDEHWAPFKAPVAQWMQDWFRPVTARLSSLKSQVPALNLAI